MSTLLVQEYLKTHSFEDLQRDHGVYPRFSKSGHKFSLNYDMLEAKESDPLSQECRGLILSFADLSLHIPRDKASIPGLVPGDTYIVSFPMKRFFNEGQGAAYVNWNDPRISVMEKLDGSMIQVYHDQVKDEWHCATRSVPEANLINESGMTFRQLFEKALFETAKQTFEEFTSKLNKDNTYCFELCSPYNRIVCYYPTCSVTLLAVRNKFTHKEILPTELFGVPVVKTYHFTELKDIVEWVATQNPMDHEGVVVRDSKFNRIKIKNPGYVAFNKASDRLKTSDRALIELILLEKEDDVIPMLPDFLVEKINAYKPSVVKWIAAYDLIFKESLEEANNNDPGSKKAFAQIVCVKDYIWTAPLFFMYDKKKTMREFVKSNQVDGTWSNSFLDRVLDLVKRY